MDESEIDGRVRAVVLVEGASDRLALDALAARRGRQLHVHGVAVVPTGGATNIRRFAERYGARGLQVPLAGLCDAGEERTVRRALERAGVGVAATRADMEALGFFVCEADLEDELIRSVGAAEVEAILDAEGDLRSFRRFQQQPPKRSEPIERQLRRFMGTRSGRKAHYARVLAEAVEPSAVPRPLALLLDHVDSIVDGSVPVIRRST